VSSQSEHRWITEDVLLAIHEAQIDEHGVSTGVRDPVLLASSLARPQNAAAHGAPDIPELAALYALGVIKNHPFVDGNKRVGTVILEVFLEDNKYTLFASDEELLNAVIALAAGDISEQKFISWVRAHARPVKGRRR
jgi:death-on-curing protein